MDPGCGSWIGGCWLHPSGILAATHASTRVRTAQPAVSGVCGGEQVRALAFQNKPRSPLLSSCPRFTNPPGRPLKPAASARPTSGGSGGSSNTSARARKGPWLAVWPLVLVDNLQTRVRTAPWHTTRLPSAGAVIIRSLERPRSKKPFRSEGGFRGFRSRYLWKSPDSPYLRKSPALGPNAFHSTMQESKSRPLNFDGRLDVQTSRRAFGWCWLPF